MFRLFSPVALIPAVAVATCLSVSGGEVYFTGFENFIVGDDTIIGTESWAGSHAGMKLHGVMSQAQHGVLGIGNAAFIGGYATTTSTSTNKVVNVRRPVNLDPLALNEEVATFNVVFGIKDSTATIKRDNFEFLIYNKDSALLGGIQFDNATLDTGTLKPRRLIYRVSWNGTAFGYVLTSYNFLPETLETLQFRINFRTNRWTASLSDIPIFQDIPFYSGTNAKNFGFAMAKLAVTNAVPITNTILPGDNYMMFDDYTVRTDALSMAVEVSRTNTGAAKLVWNEEAGYSYQVEYSSDCSLWKTDLAGSSHTAALTQSATFTDPTTPVPDKRFFRIKRTYP